MPNKAKPRWDLTENYFRSGFPISAVEKQKVEKEIQRFGEKILSITNCDISKEKINEFIEAIFTLTAEHSLRSQAQSNRNIPTPAEYKATFTDLINSLKGSDGKYGIEDKLNALNAFPFDHEISLYLIDLEPDKLPCDLIEETIKNLKLIRKAATNAAGDIKTNTGRRTDIYNSVSFLTSLAGVYEEYTSLRPTAYADDELKSRFAEFVSLCNDKAKIVIPNFRSKITDAVKEYENSKEL